MPKLKWNTPLFYYTKEQKQISPHAIAELKLTPSLRFTRFTEIERIFREMLYPEMPSYDVVPNQSIDFEEYTYSESLHAFVARTMNRELNFRLIREAFEQMRDKAANEINSHTSYVKEQGESKWRNSASTAVDDALAEGYFPQKIWFPPGGNQAWIVNVDELFRQFTEDPTWHCKPHPLSTVNTLKETRDFFGATRILDPRLDLFQLLHCSELNTLGYTTASEIGLLGHIFDKDVVNFSTKLYEDWGFHAPIYSLLEAFSSFPPCEVLDLIYASPISGYIPLYLTDEEVRFRITSFLAFTKHLRKKYKPLSSAAPLPLEVAHATQSSS